MDERKVLIELKNFSAKNDTQGFLRDISIKLYSGENVLFFGPEGSGLDLLFPAMMGFVDDYSGDILFSDESIRDLDYTGKHNHKKNFGYLHGDYGLMSNMSVRQNISLPLEYHSRMTGHEIRQHVNTLIDDLNLDHCKNLRPVDLTRSEILRTAYARSIAMDPQVLLIEHPLEGQSPMNAQSFLVHLRQRASDKTKTHLFIAYEPEKYLDLVDRFIMLFNGRIVFQGASEQYMSSNDPYLAQYREKSQTGPMAIL